MKPTEAAGQAPQPPAGAVTVFGSRLPQARRYADLLVTAGVERGLIGPREADRIWERHLLNSVALAPLIPFEATVIDLGSGAGLPGIPLVLVRPDLSMTLVEPLLRRSAFLVEACQAAGIPDVTVIRSRAEDLTDVSVDVVVARAVAPLTRLVPWALPLLRPGGTLLALKGRTVEDEISQAVPLLRRGHARSWEVRVIDVPGLEETTRAVVVVAGVSGRQR